MRMLEKVTKRPGNPIPANAVSRGLPEELPNRRIADSGLVVVAMCRPGVGHERVGPEAVARGGERPGIYQ